MPSLPHDRNQSRIIAGGLAADRRAGRHSASTTAYNKAAGGAEARGARPKRNRKRPPATAGAIPPALPSLYVPLARAERDKEHPPKQITLILRSMGEKDRDKLRIKTLYGTLISFHGIDRFSFQIYESGKGHLIDFPNDTTRICPELLARLQKLVGEDSWRVEEITFQ